MVNLNKILASFKKTQAQLDKYIEEKDSQINDLCAQRAIAENEKRQAAIVNGNLKKLLGEV